MFQHCCAPTPLFSNANTTVFVVVFLHLCVPTQTPLFVSNCSHHVMLVAIVMYFTILQLYQVCTPARVHHVITRQCWCMRGYMIEYTGIIMCVSVYMVQLHVVYWVPTPIPPYFNTTATVQASTACFCHSHASSNAIGWNSMHHCCSVRLSLIRVEVSYKAHLVGVFKLCL